MERDVLRDVKVGVFVFLTIALGALAVFVLGGSTQMFEDRYNLSCSFLDVGGLREGAVVRLAGFDVGEVKTIQFADDIGVKEIHVELSLMSRFRERIREDSVARIETEGMLGDKYVSLTVGDSTKRELADGESLEVQESVALVEYQKMANGILADIDGIAEKVNLAMGTDQEATKASVANVVASVDTLLTEAKEGDGLIHALVYDKALATRLNRTVNNLETASADLANVTREVRTGNGFANALIYGDEGEKLAEQLAMLAEAVEKLVRDIESEDSLIHALVYDPERAGMVEDLHATATSMRAIAASIEEGEGTAGMLANDPALYEDLRALVGGAQRNKLLRAYIRQTVSEGEQNNAQPWTPPEE